MLNLARAIVAFLMFIGLGNAAEWIALNTPAEVCAWIFVGFSALSIWAIAKIGFKLIDIYFEEN